MWPHRRQPTRLPHPWDSPGKNTGVGCHFLLQCVKVKSEREVAQSYLTLLDPIDCSLPGSSVHGIFQARVLEWGATAFSLVAHNSVYLGVTLQWHFSIYLHLWPTFFSRQGSELFFLSKRYADGSPPKEIPHDLIQDATPLNACVILSPFPPALGISSLFHPSSTPPSFLYSDKDCFSSSHFFHPECRLKPREIKS